MLIFARAFRASVFTVEHNVAVLGKRVSKTDDRKLRKGRMPAFGTALEACGCKERRGRGPSLNTGAHFPTHTGQPVLRAWGRTWWQRAEKNGTLLLDPGD